MSNMYAKDLEYNNNSDTCILIFHGFTGAPLDMKDLAEQLAEEGYDIFVPLLPFHGIDFEHLSNLKLNDFFAWGQNLIETKRKEYSKLVVIGVSIGAALTYVSEVKKPIADIFIGISSTGVFSLGLKIFTFISRFIRIKYLPYNPLEDFDEKYFDKEYLRWKEEYFAKMPMDVFVEAVKQSKNFKHEANKIIAPLLIINGSKDPTSSRRSLTHFVKEAKSKAKKGVIIKGGRHVIVNSKYHEQIVTEIKEFIRTVFDNDSDETFRLNEIKIVSK
ncbi:MAG: alpha/beta hydrolase [Candidatus Heimdallarchaeaceae archaeon]